MIKKPAVLLLLLCVSAVSCTTNTNPGNVQAGPVALKMSVGTLNDSADSIGSLVGGPGAGTWVNVVASFRNQFGASAFINPGTATLTGPSLSLPVGQIFSYGQAPLSNGVGGFPPAYTPASTGPSAAYATGFIYTAAPPTPGTYSLNTVVQNNGQKQPFGASATLPATPTVLPNEAPPTYVSGGATGGGTFTVTVPAGVTETLVVVYSSGVEVASAETKNTTATLPPGTLTQGTSYTAFALGADYPLVEAGPPANASMTPTLTGASGTSDLTASAMTTFTQ